MRWISIYFSASTLFGIGLWQVSDLATNDLVFATAMLALATLVVNAFAIGGND